MCDKGALSVACCKWCVTASAPPGQGYSDYTSHFVTTYVMPKQCYVRERSLGLQFTATMEKKARISASVVSKVIITLSLVFTVGAIVIVGNTAGVSPPLPVEWDYQAPTAVFGAMTMIALIDVIFPPSKLTLQRKLAPVTLTLSLMGLVS